VQKEIRKRMVITFSAFIMPVILVIILFKLSKTPNLIPNGFTRQFISHPAIAPRYFKKLPSSDHYIAGNTKSQIYVADYFKPSKVQVYDSNLVLKVIIQLGDSDTEFKSTQVEVDSPFIYLYNGTKETITIYRLKFDSVKLLRSLYIDKTPFNRACFLSTSTFFLRTASTEKFTLSKFTECSPLKTSAVLQKQVDGFFCTDGLMAVDHISSHFFYMYYYRNQFICMDSNLHVFYQRNTIDTNRFAKLSVIQTGKSSFTSMSTATTPINRQICITASYFLVNSALLADNENRILFSKSSVIDSYDLKTGGYRFSFYLTHFNKITLKSFVALGHNKIAAIEGNYILIYPVDINL
jgi:hypothetical protein